MSIRAKIANWISGGEITRLEAELASARKEARLAIVDAYKIGAEESKSSSHKIGMSVYDVDEYGKSIFREAVRISDVDENGERHYRYGRKVGAV